MCTTPLVGKIRKKITKYYENTEIRGSKVIKKRNSRVSYFRNTCFFACLFFACMSPFLFYRVRHCKRIEIKSLCHMHQAYRKLFFYIICRGGGGTIQRRDGPNERQGRTRGKWGYAP